MHSALKVWQTLEIYHFIFLFELNFTIATDLHPLIKANPIKYESALSDYASFSSVYSLLSISVSKKNVVMTFFIATDKPPSIFYGIVAFYKNLRLNNTSADFSLAINDCKNKLLYCLSTYSIYNCAIVLFLMLSFLSFYIF
jgi:hypothetical protein